MRVGGANCNGDGVDCCGGNTNRDMIAVCAATLLFTEYNVVLRVRLAALISISMYYVSHCMKQLISGMQHSLRRCLFTHVERADMLFILNVFLVYLW